MKKKPPVLTVGFNTPFEEAIAAAKLRGVELPDVYYGDLQGIARQLAFSIAGVASLDQLQAVKDSLHAAMKDGVSFKEWKTSAEAQNLSLPAHRLDNIWRTNLQGNYMRGKWEQFQRNAERRPFLMYDAINDSRVRPSHLAHDGVIRNYNDPFWQTHSPPLGYRCRCSLISLTTEQARARTGVDSDGNGTGMNKTPLDPDGNPAVADKGWDYNPFADRMQGVNKAVKDKSDKLLEEQAKAHKEYLRQTKAKTKENLIELAKEEGKLQLERSMAKLQANMAQWKFEEAKAGNLGKWYSDAAKQWVAGQGKTLDELAAELQATFQKKISLGFYKKAVIEGKKPGKGPKAVFDSLPQDEKDAILAEINSVKKPQAAAPKLATGKVAAAKDIVVIDDADGWKKVGTQLGSNPGGTYIDHAGDKWYVKVPTKEAQAYNEVLTARLYELANVEVASVKLVNIGGKTGVASRWVDGLVEDSALLKTRGTPGVGDGFGTDAWLANWDVVGFSFDNLKLLNGRAVRVDTGGGLLFRARGGLKGNAFGTSVTELKSMLDPSISPNAAAVFGQMTEAEIKASVARVVALSDEAIDRTVLLHGYGTVAEREALSATLKARRDFLTATYPDVMQQVATAKGYAANGVIEKVKEIADYLDQEIELAIKGVASRAAKLAPLEDKDFARVAGVMARYQELLDNSLELADHSRAMLTGAYKPWLDHLQNAIAGGPGSTATWNGGMFYRMAHLAAGVDVDKSKLRVFITPEMFNLAATGGGPKFTGAEVLDIIRNAERRLGYGDYLETSKVPTRGAEGKSFDAMPPEYKRIIWSWTPSNIYRAVTRELCNFAYDGVPLRKDVELYRDALNDALKHAPKARIYKGLSTRGHTSDPDEIKKQLDKLKAIKKAGGLYSPESFMSSTRGNTAAFQKTLEYSIQGKSGVHIKSISEHPGREDEVLFGTEAKFQVKEIKGPDKYGKIIVQLLEV